MADYITADQNVFREHLHVREHVGNYYVSLVGLRQYEAAALIETVRNGLNYAAFERFSENLGLPRRQLLQLLQLPLRTLQRRKREGVLHPDESDRMLRAARVFAHAVALFEGDYEAARKWFVRPLKALSNVSPLECASTELGAREVEALIGRLEYGIPQ